MKVLPQPFITRQKTADKFVLKQMTHPVNKHYEILHTILGCPYTINAPYMYHTETSFFVAYVDEIFKGTKNLFTPIQILFLSSKQIS